MNSNSFFPDEMNHFYCQTAIKLFEQGNYLAAEEMFHSALEWAERYNGCIDKQIEIMNNLGLISYAKDKFEDSALYFKAALELIETQFNYNFENLPAILYNYATALKLLGHNQEALGLENCLHEIEKLNQVQNMHLRSDYLTIDQIEDINHHINEEVA